MKHTALALVAVLTVGGVSAAYAAEEGPAPGIYLIDAPLAPVCLVGTFPVTVTTDAGAVSGTASLTTDVRGRLGGTLSLGGATYEVSGSVVSSSKGYRMAMQGKSGKHRISFAGTLGTGVLAGTTKGKGPVAAGKGSFTMDVSSSPPQVASIMANLAPGKNGKLSGTASVIACGTQVDLKVATAPGRTFKMSFFAKGFRFTGKGVGPLAWSCKGYGASATGENLPLDALPAPSGLSYTEPSALYEEAEPIAPNAPAAQMPLFTTYEVTPALPAGLTIDAATGVISGMPLVTAPQSNYAVTATNAAGSTQALVTFTVRLNRSRSFAPDADPKDDDDYRHFLRRTQWGVRPSELAALQSGGLDAYVDAMLVLPQSSDVETAANALLVNTSDPAGYEGYFPSATQCARWWTTIMSRTTTPFQETLAFFWHDHFGVSCANFEGSQRRWMVDHVNLLRKEGAGNLRELLLDVSRDPAMLKFLDGVQNTKSRPNENYARELWELFSLGVDNGYTQADITESARALTGYRETYDSATGLNHVVLDLTRHDVNAKSFFGVTIPGQNVTDDYQAVVDITIENRPVAEFVTKKLFEYFCYEAPPQSLVDDMAANLRAANYEIAPFLRALFRSEAFFSKRARRALVKSPLEFTIGFLRSTGLETTTNSQTAPVFDVGAIDGSLNAQAQRLTQPPTVDGWPSGDLWLAAPGMVERINVVRACLDDTTDQNRVGIGVATLLPPVEERTADAVVDTLAALLDVQLTAEDRTGLVDYLNTVRDAAGNVTASPFNGASQQHLDERVRGLIYALTQHPTYHSR